MRCEVFNHRYTDSLFQQVQEVLTVAIFDQGCGQPLHSPRIYSQLRESNFSGQATMSLGALQRGNEACGFEQTVVCARAQPSITPAHDFHIQLV